MRATITWFKYRPVRAIDGYFRMALGARTATLSGMSESRMRRGVRRFAAPAIGVLALLIAAPPASGAFPGAPGPIAYSKIVPGETEFGHAGGLFAHPPLLGQPPLQLTGNPTDESPAYSANGRLIAFASSRNDPDAGEKGGERIFVMRSNGRGIRQVTPGAFEFSDSNPSFSPNGRRIVFQRYRPKTRTTHIFSVRINGRGLRQLTRGRSVDSEPTYSPNGRWIAFVSNRRRRGSGGSDIFSMRPNGRHVRMLVGGPSRDFAPDVSPEGRRIAFASDRGGTAANVFVKRIGRRSRVRRLTSGTGPCPVEGCYANPSWSPNGRQIAVWRRTEAAFAIAVIPANGGGGIQVFENNGASFLGPPAWGPSPR